jgi:hypothetical protein
MEDWYLTWIFNEDKKYVANLKKDKKIVETKGISIYKHIGKFREELYLLNSKGISPLT